MLKRIYIYNIGWYFYVAMHIRKRFGGPFLSQIKNEKIL